MNNLYQFFLTKLYKSLCNRKLRQVSITSPFTYDSKHDVVVLSMVGKRVVYDYLVAIKSFLMKVDVKEVHILSDGTLDSSNIATLTQHLPQLKIHYVDELDMSGLPTGNCWERLVTLLSLAEKSYVIQLDADIVINGDLDEINQAIANNVGFILGNEKWSTPVSAQEMSDIAQQWSSEHIQGFSERYFNRINILDDVKYFRGCAAFVGLPASDSYLPLLKTFSAAMENAIGDRWYSWGSEQVASNVICSFADGIFMLPWPKYQTYQFPVSNTPIEDASLIHFMGTYRYHGNKYTNIASKAISAMY